MSYGNLTVNETIEFGEDFSVFTLPGTQLIWSGLDREFWRDIARDRNEVGSSLPETVEAAMFSHGT